MRVLLDTNVVLDVLLKRNPWMAQSAAVWDLCDKGLLEGSLGATTITDIFYFSRRAINLEAAHNAVQVCLDTFAICEVNRVILEAAKAKSGNDFEDNILIACAEMHSLDGIVTRDKKGFKDAAVPAYTPHELLQEMNTNE